MKVPWKTPDGRIIYLLTLPELQALPAGTKIISIMGDTLVTPVDDDETRADMTAYGLASEVKT